ALCSEAKARVVYICRTTSSLPFGPASSFPSSSRTELMRQVCGFISNTKFGCRYMLEFGDLRAVDIPLPVMTMGKPPFPDFGNFAGEFITIVNPCQIKGISIFLELARRRPELNFMAVPTWGTTDEDLEALRGLANITIVPAVDDIDEIFSRTRVLLVPSLWAEMFGRITLEALLRGIPVMASDVGGLGEALLGLDYLLPVREIEGYEEYFDSQFNPVPRVPEQDVEPWLGALDKLTSDPEHYRHLSQQSRATALAHLARNQGVEPVENFLANLSPKGLQQGEKAVVCVQDQIWARIHSLSPGRRALLL
ncbi:unnamed protein product, partial [Phaeothamnion confervicola]